MASWAWWGRPGGRRRSRRRRPGSAHQGAKSLPPGARRGLRVAGLPDEAGGVSHASRCALRKERAPGTEIGACARARLRTGDTGLPEAQGHRARPGVGPGHQHGPGRRAVRAPGDGGRLRRDQLAGATAPGAEVGNLVPAPGQARRQGGGEARLQAHLLGLPGVLRVGAGEGVPAGGLHRLLGAHAEVHQVGDRLHVPLRCMSPRSAPHGVEAPPAAGGSS